jgi:hypothetical protein
MVSGVRDAITWHKYLSGSAIKKTVPVEILVGAIHELPLPKFQAIHKAIGFIILIPDT